MAYRPHTLITLGGALTEVEGEDEIWQIGIRGVNPTGGSDLPVAPGQFENLMDAINVPLQNWFKAPGHYMSNSSALQFIKVANIGADGKYTTDALEISFPEVRGGQQAAVPSFLSVCISWSTGSKARAGARGRIYPPNFAEPQVVGAASLQAGGAARQVTVGQAFLAAVDVSGDQFRFQPHVMSRQGPYRPITGVRVGNVYDVQRRRKDAVRETYNSDVYPVGA